MLFRSEVLFTSYHFGPRRPSSISDSLKAVVFSAICLGSNAEALSARSDFKGMSFARVGFRSQLLVQERSQMQI